MSEDMYDDGFVKNYNIDISKKCIEMMLNRNVFRRPEIEWSIMDCRKLTYEDESFDLIIDKSTLDCLMCGATAELDVCQMIKEIQRILKTNGLYVIISLESSENREFVFEMPHLSFEVEYI